MLPKRTSPHSTPKRNLSVNAAVNNCSDLDQGKSWELTDTMAKSHRRFNKRVQRMRRDKRKVTARVALVEVIKKRKSLHGKVIKNGKVIKHGSAH